MCYQVWCSSGFNFGSIIFPALYINDLPNATELAECLFFAHDTAAFLSHSDLRYLISKMNTELEKNICPA